MPRTTATINRNKGISMFNYYLSYITSLWISKSSSVLSFLEGRVGKMDLMWFEKNSHLPVDSDYHRFRISGNELLPFKQRKNMRKRCVTLTSSRNLTNEELLETKTHAPRWKCMGAEAQIYCNHRVTH